ncbi:MAG: methyltransferase domain-containing protein [Armatimonadetes bacterium]|nr:methyltransferase domain-containing protein [Armatimonadota bacterium]
MEQRVEARSEEQPEGQRSPEEQRFSFAKFASHSFFTEVNRWLVEHVGPLRDRLVVDLGCGPGAVTTLILERMERQGRGKVFAVDPSLVELGKARQRITSEVVSFIQGSAEEISRLVPPVHVVLFCNAIHLVANKQRVIEEIRRALLPGGVLAFNSTFFAGCYHRGTDRFWRVWLVRALQYLKEKRVTVSREAKALAMQWLTPEHYRDLLQQAGFTDVQMEMQVVDMNCQSLEDISEFSMFIEGALPGIPLDLASEALKAGVRRAFDDMHLTTVPRNWLQVLART